MRIFEENNYFELWFKSLLKLPSLQMESPIHVEGHCKKHLGPRLEYAVIEFMVTPSETFAIEFSNGLSNLDNESQELMDSAIYGVLDVIMTANILPLRNITLSVLTADIHPIDSNRAAFRKAGRDAGLKIMQAIDS